MTQTSRIGVDVASVEAVANSLATFGAAYLTRVYTARELELCGGGSPHPGRLAERFAAKEAVAKALGVHDEPLDVKDVEIGADRAGRCVVHLTASAERVARREGLVGLAVSVSRAANCATALAVATFAAAEVRS